MEVSVAKHVLIPFASSEHICSHCFSDCFFIFSRHECVHVTFNGTIPMTGDSVCRGFKALKQSTKLLFLVLRRPEDALKTYRELLAYTKSAVTRNYAEKTINSILDYVGGGKSGPVEVNVLERFYEATKGALAEAKNEVSSFDLGWYLSAQVVVQRLSAKTNLKLAKLWLDRKEYHRLTRVCINDVYVEVYL